MQPHPGAFFSYFYPFMPGIRSRMVLLSLTVTVQAADLSGFVDQGSVSDFAVGPMQWAVAQELIFGVGGNAIAPSWLQCCTVFAKCSPEPGTYICSRHGGASIRMRPCFAPHAEKV